MTPDTEWEEIVDELLTSSSGLPYGITIGFNQEVLGQRQGFQKYGGYELRVKLIELLTSRDACWKERVGAIKKLYEDQCVEEIGFVVKGDKVWEALDNLK